MTEQDKEKCAKLMADAQALVCDGFINAANRKLCEIDCIKDKYEPVKAAA